MPDFVEINPAQRDSDTGGDSARTRQWRSVTGGYTIDQVDANPGGYDLPVKGSTYEGLVLDRYSFAYDGATIVATGYYSKAGRFRLNKPRPPIQPGDEPRWEFVTVTRTLDVPYAYKQRTTWGDSGAADLWYADTFKVKAIMRRWSIVVAIPESQRNEAAEAIAEQQQKIHRLIDNRLYLFESGALSWDADTYRVEYSWLYDPGQPNPDTDVPSSIVVPEGLSGIGSGPYSVPPYKSVFLIPGTDASVAPTFGAKLDYEYDPEGWQTLVGLVL